MVALAIFIVLNTFQMNLSERRTRLAVLRAVGATRRQILQMLLSETLAMGVVGAVFGCLLGLAGAHLLLRVMARLSASAPIPLQLSCAPFVLAMLLGIGVAVLATYLPAGTQAGSRPWKQFGLRRRRCQHAASRLTTVGGAALFVVSGAGGRRLHSRLAADRRFHSRRRHLSGGLRLGHPRTGAAVGAFRPHVDLPASASGRRFGRATTGLPQRAGGLTVGVLYIAIAAGVGLGTTIINNVQDVHNWNRRTMEGDFLVCAAFADPTTARACKCRKPLGDEIRSMNGVVSVDTIRYFHVPTGSDTGDVIARDFAESEPLPLVLTEGKPEEVRRRLCARAKWCSARCWPSGVS